MWAWIGVIKLIDDRRRRPAGWPTGLPICHTYTHTLTSSSSDTITTTTDPGLRGGRGRGGGRGAVVRPGGLQSQWPHGFGKGEPGRGGERCGLVWGWCVSNQSSTDGHSIHKPLSLSPCVSQVTCPNESHILDHFVTPLPYEYRVFSDNVLSDHYPVLATIQLR